MDKAKIIKDYQYFFDDQIREIEAEQKTLANTPIAQLLRKEELCYGFVDHVNNERGHIILKFPKDKGPRLKVLKSLTLVTLTAVNELGSKPSMWSCTLKDFMSNNAYHKGFTELMPLYYIHKNDSSYDYVGCSSIELGMFDLIKGALEKGKTPRVLVYSPFPPIDLLKNMNNYMELYPSNEELYIKPIIPFKDWKPEELEFSPANPTGIADCIMETLEQDDVCILQGPPGTGKSYTIAQILAHHIEQGKTCCVTTMANKGLIELVQQPPLKRALEAEKISKSNLSADEKHQVPKLKKACSGQIVPRGELLCSTNYVLSFAFTDKNIEEHGLPSYELIVIEEASQAFLTSIAAFKSLGVKCLIVGDPMQLPPIVANNRKSIYKSLNANTQAEGLLTYALGTDIKSYRITTTFRLTAKGASLTGIFYNNRFKSVKQEILNFDKIKSPLFPNEGGVIYHCTENATNGVYSRTALNIIAFVIDCLQNYYKKRSLAIISPFKDTVKQLQKTFLADSAIDELTIETIDRIQGMTVDYAILYLPARNPGFALDERRFNVATSRSRSTTLILSDIPLHYFHSVTPNIRHFLDMSQYLEHINVNNAMVQSTISERDEIKFMYPGLEDIVDQLLDNNIPFNHDGEVDLQDKDGIVLASAGMLLKEQQIAIDPTDYESEKVFERAGYKVISSQDFNINDIK